MRWLSMKFPLCLTGYLKPNCMTSKKKMKGDNLDKTTLKHSSTYATSNLHAINAVPANGYFMDFQELNTAVAGEITDVVRYWMRWMMFIFILSLAFVKRYKAARWTFISIIGTVICGVIIWILSKSIHLIGIAHLIVWTPLAIYFWKTTLSPRAESTSAAAQNINKQGLYHKSYMLWSVLIFVTILISLVFDVRDVFLVATGVK